MDAAYEQRVRERAYEIWLAAGMDGAADAHWYSAEDAMKTEAAKPASAKVKAAPKTVMDRVAKTGTPRAGAKATSSRKGASTAVRADAHA
jgi:hypothetical protein